MFYNNFHVRIIVSILNSYKKIVTTILIIRVD